MLRRSRGHGLAQVEPDNETLRALAHHEAAHAVTAWALGTGTPSLKLSQEGWGRARYPDSQGNIWRDWNLHGYEALGAERIEEEAIRLMAGPISEDYVTSGASRKWSEYYLENAEQLTQDLNSVFNDLMCALDLLGGELDAPDGSTVAHLDAVQAKTEHILRDAERWAAVEALAERLFRRRYLRPSEVRSTIRGAIRGQARRRNRVGTVRARKESERDE